VNWLLVLFGAAVGAPLRYLVDTTVKARHDSVFPWGTFLVNVAGSLLLGLLAGAATGHAVPESVRLLVGVGFCGALTTYSTFGYETLRLVEDGAFAYAAGNVAVSLAVGVGAAFLGAAVAGAF
jgi:CrcB protein